MKIGSDIAYVGVNDHEVDLFEGQYVVPLGMAYNSYVISDAKVAVMDTVDVNFGEEWLKNIADVLGARKPDYLVVQHMEPDHWRASISSLRPIRTRRSLPPHRPLSLWSSFSVRRSPRSVRS